MRQCEFKKKYNSLKCKHEKSHIYGEGIYGEGIYDFFRTSYF